jgi:DNA-binding CsgD family transcriptional regulator
VLVDLVRAAEDQCRRPVSAKELRQGLLEIVRARIPYDGYVFPLTDPVTMVATAPLADVPMLPWPRLPELIRWRYLTTLNRWDTLLGLSARSLLGATESPSESPMWRHVQSDLGVVDTAMVAFGDRYGAWGCLELVRTTEPFTSGELAMLTSLQAPVTAGLRACVARTFVDPADQLVPVGPAVVVLAPDLSVRTQTEAAAQALLQLLPPDEPMAPIPAAAYNVGAALVAQEEGVPIGEPWSRVHLGGSRWVTTKASRLGDDIAVSIEPSAAAERMDLFARAHGLSQREAEILGLLGSGLDTREIAGSLFLSEHTVNDHVKAMLAKAGARTRQVLLARVVGG